MAGEILGPSIELPPIKTLVITLESLRVDNQSEEAKIGIGEYERHASNGDLVAGEACGDSKTTLPLPEQTVFLRSISNGGPKDYGVFRHPKVGKAVAVTHVDGDTLEIGKMPTGCAGLREKQKSRTQSEGVVEGLSYYVHNNIAHPDPVVQALVTANEIFKKSGKPALATVQDHLTTKIYPVGVFLPNQAPNAAINLVDLAVKYDPESIYANLIPTLKDSDIPDMFREFLDAANAQMRSLLMNYSNFKETQKVSNPRFIVLSTEPRSLRIRYPKTMSRPGIAFKMHLPRERLESGTISINPSVLRDIINQVEYPFGHAADHFGKPGESFEDTDIFLIETGDWDVSYQLAEELDKVKPVKKWLSQDRHQIWVAKTEEGITTRMELLKPSA